jgi:hypothetical protein
MITPFNIVIVFKPHAGGRTGIFGRTDSGVSYDPFGAMISLRLLWR